MTTILVVDDSAFQRRTIKNILFSAGYEVGEAASGIEALDKIKTQTPDCISLDLVLPDINGIEILKTLQDQGSDIPIVVVTADIQTSVERLCLKLGAKAIVCKPIGSEELLQAIEQALADG